MYSVVLTADEVAGLRADTATHGVVAETEQTLVEVTTLRELWEGTDVDWTTLGIISQILMPIT